MTSKRDRTEAPETRRAAGATAAGKRAAAGKDDGTAGGAGAAKDPPLGWTYGRYRKVFEKLDRELVAVDVRMLRLEHPDEDEDQLVRRVIRQSSRLSAVAGFASATPALVPGIGTAVSIAALVPEEIYLTRRRCIMLLQIAAIYGFDPTRRERLYEIVTLAGTPSRSIEALMVAKEDLARLAARLSMELTEGASRAVRVGAKTGSRGVVRRLPALGFLAGGAINFYCFRSLGRKAARFYRRLRDERV